MGSRLSDFDTLVVVTPADCERLKKLYFRLLNNIKYGKIIFVGSQGVLDVLKTDELLFENVKWLDENSIIPFDEVHSCIENKMKNILAGRELPRGITGWYYQQFLKMQYAFTCENEYYMVWDGDTIPCKTVTMFQKESGKPYFDLKHEHHPEYFETIGKILPGFGKVIGQSFISEHMLFKTEYMKELVKDIENNKAIEGRRFWEKIINAIPAEKIQDSAFSEFETYGTYVAMRHSSAYKLREWHSFRQGGSFFSIDTISDSDFNWLSIDFNAISFEKGHTVREDNKNLFDNPYYQEKLTPKQMLLAAQLEYREGYKEVWGDEDKNVNYSNGAYNAGDELIHEDRLKYLSNSTYKDYEKLGDELVEKNINQAFLCYENAEYLCDEQVAKLRINEKKKKLNSDGKVTVKKTAIIVLSYNNSYMLQRCIESIYNNCNPDSYRLFIFDNASLDGTAKWLIDWGEEHDEAYVILNNENLGFSGGNNAAYSYVPNGYDPFFLNNDTRVPANALFWMRMGLYEADDIGGIGAIQNYVDTVQSVDVIFDRPEMYVEYGAENNVYIENPLEEQAKICGFAMLIRREAFETSGGFDEAFNPGFVEDDDLSLNIRSHGYRLMVCHNSFIYHAGSQSFVRRDDTHELFTKHREIVVRKWGFDSTIYASMSSNEYSFIKSLAEKGYTRESKFSLLHIGCGCGNMLGHIHYLYPKARLCGVEENDAVRRFKISCLDIYADESELPLNTDEFDIVVKDIG